MTSWMMWSSNRPLGPLMNMEWSLRNRRAVPKSPSGDATTSSAWTLPVYSTASGQPCYKSAGFTSCQLLA